MEQGKRVRREQQRARVTGSLLPSPATTEGRSVSLQKGSFSPLLPYSKTDLLPFQSNLHEVTSHICDGNW